MNVLHVIPAVAARYGGPSQAVFDMCRALEGAGMTTQIATTDADGAGHLPVTLGEPIVYRDVRTIFFRRQWSESFKYSRGLRRWLSQSVRRFDVVHIHGVYSHASLAAAAASRASGVPYIVRPLGTLSSWALRQKPLRKRIGWSLGAGKMVAGAAAIHCTSAPEAHDLSPANLQRQAIVIPLGVNAAGPNLSTQTAAAPYVLALGRIHPKKGLDLLIRAFAQVTANDPGLDTWRLLIAGSGDDAYVAHLRELADSCGAGTRVRFTGWVAGDARESILSGAALLAMPSHQENFGFASFEAMARGIAVIVASSTDFAEEIAGAGAGWIAEAQDESLATVLADAMRNQAERRRRGDAGRALVDRRFTWERVALDLKAAYAGVIQAAS